MGVYGYEGWDGLVGVGVGGMGPVRVGRTARGALCSLPSGGRALRSQLLEPLHGGGDRLSNGCQLATLLSGGLQCPPRWVAMLRLVKMLCENAGVMG